MEESFTILSDFWQETRNVFKVINYEARARSRNLRWASTSGAGSRLDLSRIIAKELIIGRLISNFSIATPKHHLLHKLNGVYNMALSCFIMLWKNRQIQSLLCCSDSPLGYCYLEVENIRTWSHVYYFFAKSVGTWSMLYRLNFWNLQNLRCLEFVDMKEYQKQKTSLWFRILRLLTFIKTTICPRLSLAAEF